MLLSAPHVGGAAWEQRLFGAGTGEFLRISPLKFYFYKFNVMYRTTQVSVCFFPSKQSLKPPFHQHVHQWESFISELAFRCE